MMIRPYNPGRRPLSNFGFRAFVLGSDFDIRISDLAHPPVLSYRPAGLRARRGFDKPWQEHDFRDRKPEWQQSWGTIGR